MPPIMPSTAISDTTTVYSNPLVMFKDSGFSIAIEYTGTITAAVTLQLGIKKPVEDGGGYIWGDTTETFPSVPAGGAGSSVESWAYQNADAVRLKVVPASGTGTFRAYAKVK